MEASSTTEKVRVMAEVGAGPIGVGIIGVNAQRGWAAAAHVPALHALPQFELRAVSSSRQSSAEEAAAAFSVPAALSDPVALVERSDVDLVVVTVKVPQHRELVMAALAAEKAVYCEWPLARDLAEAEELRDLATSRAGASVVGLQARATPAIRYVRDLIAAGHVGEVLSTTLLGSSRPGPVIDQANAYLADRANGANLLSIDVGHTLDTLCFCLTEIDAVSAVLQTRRPFLTVRETGQLVQKSSPDQVLVSGRLKGGAVASLHLREGLVGATGLLWEINGTEGTLQVSAPGALPGIYPLTVSDTSNRSLPPAVLPVPDRYWNANLRPLAGTPAHNVGCVYTAFAADRATGSKTVASFFDAAARHRTLDTIERAGLSGTYLEVAE